MTEYGPTRGGEIKYWLPHNRVKAGDVKFFVGLQRPIKVSKKGHWVTHKKVKLEIFFLS